MSAENDSQADTPGCGKLRFDPKRCPTHLGARIILPYEGNLPTISRSHNAHSARDIGYSREE